MGQSRRNWNEVLRGDILMEGCYEFGKLVILKFLYLIPELERREWSNFNNLEEGSLFNELNQISQLVCKIHQNI